MDFGEAFRSSCGWSSPSTVPTTAARWPPAEAIRFRADSEFGRVTADPSHRRLGVLRADCRRSVRFLFEQPVFDLNRHNIVVKFIIKIYCEGCVPTELMRGEKLFSALEIMQMVIYT